MSEDRREFDIQPASLGFALGVLLLLQMPQLPPAWMAPLLATGLLSLCWIPAAQRWLLPPLLGLAWAWGHAAWQLDRRLEADLQGIDLVMTGVVRGLPEQTGGRARFLLEVESLEGAPESKRFQGMARLSWYRSPPELLSGERWRLKVRLKQPHGFANPGAFDYEGWLYREGVGATGYVKADPGNLPLGHGGPSLDRFRQGLAGRLDQVLGRTRAAGLARALILGDRGGLDNRQWEALTRTGTNHLVAISGLHVGIVGGLAFFLMRFLWRGSRFLAQRLAADRAAAVAAMGAAFGYAALAGFAVSTQRALIMLAVLFAAVLLRRNPRPQAGLSLALGAVLIVDPMAGLSPGFWLSFGAVAVLAYGMLRRVGRSGFAWRWGRAQWLVAVGLAPLVLLLFGRVSLAAPLVNLLAVPLFSLLLLPAVLLGAVLLFATGLEFPLVYSVWVLEAAYSGLERLADLHWVAWSLPDKPLWVWLSACAAVVLLLAPRGLPGRWLGLVALLPLASVQPPTPPPGGFRFTLLDVGQGLAAVVQTQHHLLVYDTGPGFPSGFNTGDAVVAPFLRAQGLARVDTLVVSHADIDHAGGVAGLLGRIPADRILAGEPREMKGRDAEQCRGGMSWEWDGVDFQVLHPRAPFPTEGNDRSCVLRVSSSAGALLLTGDAPSKVERELARRYGQGLRSQVLVAGHHGSSTSSSAVLLDAVRPHWVLFSAGYRNRYGFPRRDVLERVREHGARLASTVSGGALTMEFVPGNGPVSPTPYRSTHPRYWRHRPPVLTVEDSGYDGTITTGR